MKKQLMIVLGLFAASSALAQDVWVYDGGVQLALAEGKYRNRVGTPDLKGGETFSRDLGTQEKEFRPGFWVRATKGDNEFRLSAWSFESSGDGEFSEDTAYDGTVYPAGTKTSTDVEHTHAKGEWLHAFHPAESLKLKAGAALEYTSFDSDASYGDSSLEGIYATPQLRALWSFLPGWELEALYGGFFMQYKMLDPEITDIYETELAARKVWERTTVEIGYNLLHLHIEEDANEVEEDIVHLRHQSVYASVGYRF